MKSRGGGSRWREGGKGMRIRRRFVENREKKEEGVGGRGGGKGEQEGEENKELKKGAAAATFTAID